DLHAWPRHVRLEVPNLAAARALLGELGLDRREGSTRFFVTRHSSLSLGPVIGVAIGAFFFVVCPMLMRSGVQGILARMALLAAAILPFLYRRIELIVGADGVELRRRIGKPRYIPHTRIRDIRRINAGFKVSPGFILVLDDGSCIPIDTRSERFAVGVWA